MMHGQANIR